MIQSKGLSPHFWAKAIQCANYIINRTPAKALKNITPEEAWSSVKPNVSHFRVFGSEAWAHIPDDKHKSLEPKSENCIFVGYSEYVNNKFTTFYTTRGIQQQHTAPYTPQ